eukprot:1161073-Pelagomonas_calceolata.AAC.3
MQKAGAWEAIENHSAPVTTMQLPLYMPGIGPPVCLNEHKRSCAHTHTHTHKRKRTRIHTHTRTYTHIHIQVWDASGSGCIRWHAQDAGVEHMGVVAENSLLQVGHQAGHTLFVLCSLLPLVHPLQPCICVQDAVLLERLCANVMQNLNPFKLWLNLAWYVASWHRTMIPTSAFMLPRPQASLLAAMAPQAQAGCSEALSSVATTSPTASTSTQHAGSSAAGASGGGGVQCIWPATIKGLHLPPFDMSSVQMPGPPTGSNHRSHDSNEGAAVQGNQLATIVFEVRTT